MENEKKKGFLQTFLAEDFPKIKNYIWEEMVKPAAKKTASDIVHNTASAIANSVEAAGDIAINHDTKRKYMEGRNYGRSSASVYQGNYRGNVDGYVEPDNGYKKIYLRSRQECENILMDLDQRIQDYGRCTLNDYYETVGISGTAADQYYGWVNLRTARPEQTQQGWTIRFPRPINLR